MLWVSCSTSERHITKIVSSWQVVQISLNSRFVGFSGPIGHGVFFSFFTFDDSLANQEFTSSISFMFVFLTPYILHCVPSKHGTCASGLPGTNERSFSSICRSEAYYLPFCDAYKHITRIWSFAPKATSTNWCTTIGSFWKRASHCIQTFLWCRGGLFFSNLCYNAYVFVKSPYPSADALYVELYASDDIFCDQEHSLLWRYAPWHFGNVF